MLKFARHQKSKMVCCAMVIYEGAGHAFFNDTGVNYNANAAKDAWAKMLAWFEKYLTG